LGRTGPLSRGVGTKLGAGRGKNKDFARSHAPPRGSTAALKPLEKPAELGFRRD
jgi:hypothetical protein